MVREREKLLGLKIKKREEVGSNWLEGLIYFLYKE